MFPQLGWPGRAFYQTDRREKRESERRKERDTRERKRAIAEGERVRETERIIDREAMSEGEIGWLVS